MSKIQRCLLAASVTITFDSRAQAGEAMSSDTLDPVVITATRTEQPASKALASTTIIDREEIDRRQAQSVQDLLRGVPGLSIATSGGLGKVSGISMRGTNTGHLLVLIDGIRAGSISTGIAAFQDLPIDQIERIEVVRGPRSSLYGSEAIGGVIQIFTRKGGKGLQPRLSVGAGSHETFKATGGVSGGNERGWYSLNGSHLGTRGFNTCRGKGDSFPGAFDAAGCFTNEPDPDAYRNNSGSARAGYRFDNSLEVEGNLLHAEGENQYDGPISAGNRGPFVQQALGGSLRYSPTNFWNTSLTAGRTLDESTQFWNRLYVSRFNTQRVSAIWQNDFHVAEGHTLTAGLDFYNDQIASSVKYVEKSRNNKAGFAQYQLNWGAVDAVLGARVDDNEQFGVHPTGNVALGYNFDNGVRLTGSWGNAFRAPTFNDLYYPLFGNPKLQPETSESWEAGIQGRTLGVKWSVNGYYTEISNLVAVARDTSQCQAAAFFYCAQNINQAEILGLDSSLSTSIAGWNLAATFSAVDPRDPLTDRLLPRRSQLQFRFDVDRRFGPVTAGTSVMGEDRRFDDVANNQRLSGFVTVDLRAAVDIYRGLSVEGRLANLLDEHYETAQYFRQDGRNFFVTLKYAPETL